MQAAPPTCSTSSASPTRSAIVSAHRTPDRLFDYAKTRQERGLKVIIAGAGGAAHLPGMTASMTPLPVLGVPVADARRLPAWTACYSIVQMPAGVPVGTLAIGEAGATNAGLLAAADPGADRCSSFPSGSSHGGRPGPRRSPRAPKDE